MFAHPLVLIVNLQIYEKKARLCIAKMLEFMAEEIVGEGFEGVLGIGGVFIVKCVPVDGCLWDHG